MTLDKYVNVFCFRVCPTQLSTILNESLEPLLGPLTRGHGSWPLVMAMLLMNKKALTRAIISIKFSMLCNNQCKVSRLAHADRWHIKQTEPSFLKAKPNQFIFTICLFMDIQSTFLNPVAAFPSKVAQQQEAACVLNGHFMGIYEVTDRWNG